MKKQKQKIRRRKQSISNPEEPLYSSSQFSSLQKPVPNLRHIQQSYSTIPVSSQNRLHHSKSHIVKDMAQHFRHKLTIDRQVRQSIEHQNVHKFNRLKHLESQINDINQENSRKIKQLTKIQNNTMKKMEQEFIKEREIQEKLMYSYQLALKEVEKVQLTKEVKKIRERQDWIIIDQQRRKLELINRNFSNKQLTIGKDKSTEPKVRRKLGPPEDQIKKNEKNNKKQRKKKNAEELKQIGKNYLEFAKKAQAEKLKQNTKVIDVYKKSIDYLPQIKMIIKNHGKDLSRPLLPDQIPSPRLRRKRSPPARLTK